MLEKETALKGEADRKIREAEEARLKAIKDAQDQIEIEKRKVKLEEERRQIEEQKRKKREAE